MKQDLVNAYDENDRYRRVYYTLFATDTVQNLIPKLRSELRYMKVTGYKHNILSYRDPVNAVEWKIRNSKDMGSWIFSQILAGCDPIFTLDGGRVRKFAKRLVSIHSSVDMSFLDYNTFMNGRFRNDGSEILALYQFLYQEIRMILHDELKETNTRLQDEIFEFKDSKEYKKSEKEAFKKARKNKFSAK